MADTTSNLSQFTGMPYSLALNLGREKSKRPWGLTERRLLIVSNKDIPKVQGKSQACFVGSAANRTAHFSKRRRNNPTNCRGCFEPSKRR